MSKNRLGTIKKLEKLAAWHRMKADQAGADWVWEARLRTADDLERRAAEMRIISTYVDQFYIYMMGGYATDG